MTKIEFVSDVTITASTSKTALQLGRLAKPNTKSGYEVITGSGAVPYYDYDYEYDNENDQIEHKQTDIDKSLNAVRDEFPDGRSTSASCIYLDGIKR